jgi:Neuraminidase (sialidase)
MPTKSAPDVIVYRGNYPGWPWVTGTSSGKLLCAFRDDSVHGFSPTGKVLWTESSDQGRTWAAARVVVDDEGIDDRNAAIVELPDGSWMVCYNSYTREKVSRCWVTTSSDGGSRWQQPVPVGALDARTRGAPIALSAGDILLPIYKAPGSGSVAARSSDGGRTWTLAEVPDVEGFIGDEWTVYEVEKGRVVGLFRNNGPRDGFFWKSESRDGGRTWDAPRKTNVQSARSPSPPHLDFHGKTPLLTYADRRMVSVSMVMTGDPDFLLWDVGHRLPCYYYRPDQTPIADASYPVSVAVGEQRRFIVDYEIRENGHWISGYYVDLPQGWR